MKTLKGWMCMGCGVIVADMAKPPICPGCEKPFREINAARAFTVYVPYGHWVVMRQDDNGHEVAVTVCKTERTASRICSEMTANNHKQTYWVKEIA